MFPKSIKMLQRDFIRKHCIIYLKYNEDMLRDHIAFILKFIRFYNSEQ